MNSYWFNVKLASICGTIYRQAIRRNVNVLAFNSTEARAKIRQYFAEFFWSVEQFGMVGSEHPELSDCVMIDGTDHIGQA